MNLIDGHRIWNLHATHGFPLELSIPELADQGYIPTWVPLLKAAERDGTNMERLVEKICSACYDGYKKEVADIIAVRLVLLSGILNRY